jgi:YihY family inner membrane protein
VKTLLLLVGKTWQRFGEDNATQMAAAITYYVLFAIVPLSIFVLSVTTIVLDEQRKNDVIAAVEDYLNVVPEDVTIRVAGDAESAIVTAYGRDALADIEAELQAINEDASRAGRTTLSQQIDDGEAVDVAGYTLEPDHLTVHSESAVGDAVDRVAGASEALGVIGFIVTAFSASIMFMAIRRSLNFVWSVPHRPFVQQRLMEISMLFGLVVLFGASIAATAITQVLAGADDGSQNPASSIGSLVWFVTGFIVPWALTFVLVLLAYWLVPNTKNALQDVLPAAVLASVAIEILKYGYAIYVVNFSSYGAVYGALGGILLFMFFVWLSSYIFLMGAELASEYPKVMMGGYSREQTSPAGRRGLRRTLVSAVKSLFLTSDQK